MDHRPLSVSEVVVNSRELADLSQATHSRMWLKCVNMYVET
jgi:hypothetical protein